MKTAKYLVVAASVRYWEDATINGEIEDHDGIMIPFKTGLVWHPVIDLDKGKLLDWHPKGMTANIHYKVCDAGEYYLADEDMNIFAKWKDDYVPNRFLCHGDNGFGDYIILKVDGEGFIQNYVKPVIYEPEWQELSHQVEFLWPKKENESVSIDR